MRREEGRKEGISRRKLEPVEALSQPSLEEKREEAKYRNDLLR